MNTDERIDALAQNVHLLGSIQRDFETEVRQSLHVLTELHRDLAERHRDLAERHRDLAERQGESEKRMAQMMQAITRLGNIAATHEDRLDLLEGQ